MLDFDASYAALALINTRRIIFARFLKAGKQMSVMGNCCVCPVTGQKGINMKTLRKWQTSAIRVVREIFQNGGDKCLLAACPGSGKTRLAAEVMRDAFFSDCDVYVVVVPSRALKRQWRIALARVGIKAKDQIPNNHLNERAHANDEMYDPENPVQIYTYSQIANNPSLFRILCERHKVFSVFDEIHHADDEEKFGDSLMQGFEGAVFKLSLTGTPFNTKGGRLAFCETTRETDDEGRDLNRTVCDYIYSYGDALSAGRNDDPNVVRPIQFVRWNGRAEWDSLNLETGKITRKAVDGSKRGDPLSPLVEMPGDYAAKMIDAAIVKLQALREHHARAGMLITAMTREHCQEIVRYLNTRGIRDVTAIMFDTPGASDEIERWTKSDERILVAIKMISEGVDITRLRVGVYLSNVLTQMFFSQFIGRFVRWDDSLDVAQHACVFVPEHVTLIKYALDIERMVMEAENRIDGDGGDGPTPTMRLSLESDGSENGLIERQQKIDQSEAEEIRRLLTEQGLRGVISEGYAKRILDGWLKNHPRENQHTAEPTFRESTLSKDNDRIVAAIFRESEKKGRPIPYAKVNAAANTSVGIKAKDSLTPDSKLRERLDFLKRMLISVRNGQWWSDVDAAA